MSADFQRRFDDSNVAQQQFISLFLRSEREIFRYVAALVPNVSDAEDIVQQTALVLWQKFDAYDPEAARQKLKLLYLSCGNRDGLIRISQGGAHLSEGKAGAAHLARGWQRPRCDSLEKQPLSFCSVALPLIVWNDGGRWPAFRK